ncbi:hypothetical protein K488DRAFT_85880 [Vararia minispora EC-137]|uniref:Uncharacterized protein n=1 Tax=Vararia minispora EC-137 TaxID=1314806 RepID=A0ACB8QL58_9AGAM|nr:hypothetical protein K488DRAFT_85880 [Vararia minispora EC-137]
MPSIADVMNWIGACVGVIAIVVPVSLFVVGIGSVWFLPSTLVHRLSSRLSEIETSIVTLYDHDWELNGIEERIFRQMWAAMFEGLWFDIWCLAGDVVTLEREVEIATSEYQFTLLSIANTVHPLPQAFVDEWTVPDDWEIDPDVIGVPVHNVLAPVHNVLAPVHAVAVPAPAVAAPAHAVATPAHNVAYPPHYSAVQDDTV